MTLISEIVHTRNESRGLPRASGIGADAFYTKYVRCGNIGALWLLMKRVGRPSGGEAILAKLDWYRSRIGLVEPALRARWQLRSAQRLGERITLRGSAAITNEGEMTIGNRVRLVSTVATLELVTLPGGHLEIGENVFINYGSSIVASNHVTIGEGSLIGTHVMVMDCDFHRIEDKEWDTTGLPIVLGRKVWLGNRCIVLKGVTIGDEAVVAAGAVVTRDVPPRTLVAGVPAQVIRTF